MSKILIYKVSSAISLTVLAAVSLVSPYQTVGADGGGESSLESQSPSFRTLNLTLHGALAATAPIRSTVAPAMTNCSAGRGTIRSQEGAMPISSPAAPGTIS